MGESPRPRAQLGRIFVSSVFRGMSDLRLLAGEAIEALGFHAVLTELLLADDASVAASLEREIGHCDAYVGLFSRRRGTVPAGERWAITEQEFRRATELGLRRLVLVEDLPDDERDPDLVRFLDQHVAEYRTGVYAVRYGDENELRALLSASLARLRPELVLAVDDDGTARLFVERVQPACDVDGDAVQPFAFDAALDETSLATLRAFTTGAETRTMLPEPALAALGAELTGRWPQAARAVLDALLERRGEARRPLALRVRSRRHDVLALPWELASTPRHALPVRDGWLEIVREVPREGTVMLPLDDPAPTRPRTTFDVLGFTADPIEDHAATAGVGAGGLRDDSSLFWEREQERLMVALDPMLRNGLGRLILPDTGDADVLREQLGRDDRSAIVHLSCHGGPLERDGKSLQAVFLEDVDGKRRPTTAADLLAWTRATTTAEAPELWTLSACYTAAEASGADPNGRGAAAEAVAERSLALDLLRGGCRRVLGMQSSVSDAGATEMAGALYGAVAGGADLPLALRAGREALRHRGLAHEWAIPVLVQSTGLPGPLLVPPSGQQRVDTPFELARSKFELAGVSYLKRGYVGRRDYERRLFRAWRQGARLLVIHGLGGIGKSTMAARFLERREAEGVRLVLLRPGPRDAAALLDEVAAAIDVARPQDAEAKQAEQVFRDALSNELRQRPTIVVFDNFEDNQDEQTGAILGAGVDDGPPALVAALATLARLGGEHVCLLFTTRRTFELPGTTYRPVDLDLGAFSRAEARKFKLLSPGLQPIAPDVWGRILDLLGGHPKALELLDGYLAQSPDRLAQLVTDLEGAVAAVDQDLAAEVQERGRALLVDRVLDAIPAARLASLDRLSLLFAPLPTEEMVVLLEAEGIATARADVADLRARGLLARTVSSITGRAADAVHRLIARGRAHGLDPATRDAFHRRAAEHLRERPRPLADLGVAARHLDAAGDRAAALESYERWAIGLNGQHAYGAAREVVDEGMARLPARALEERVAAARLECQAYDASATIGDLEHARHALSHAQALLGGTAPEQAPSAHGNVAIRVARLASATGDPERALTSARDAAAAFAAADAPRDRAIALGAQADVLFARGELDEALRIRQEEELPVYEKLGDVSSRAVTLGKIADVLFARGELDEALRIRQEEELPVYEKLGDVRSRAVTLGKIADVLFARGELDEALRIRQEEQLPVYEKLGDVRERAVTLGQIADVLFARGELDEALRIRQEEQLPVYERLGDVRSRAVTLGQIADVLFARGELDEALRIRQEEQLPVFEKLGEVRERAVTLGKIADVLFARGELDEALRIRQEEQLPVYEKLGDVRERALTLGKIADVLFARGELDEALRIRQEEQLPVYERLGDVRSRAVTLGKIAEIEAARGNRTAALASAEQWLEGVRALQDAREIAAAQFRIAQLELGADEPDGSKVLERLAEAFQILLRLGLPDGLSAVGHLLGQLLLQIGHPDAGKVLREARTAAQKIGHAELGAALDALIAKLPPPDREAESGS